MARYAATSIRHDAQAESPVDPPGFNGVDRFEDESAQELLERRSQDVVIVDGFYPRPVPATVRPLRHR